MQRGRRRGWPRARASEGSPLVQSGGSRGEEEQRGDLGAWKDRPWAWEQCVCVQRGSRALSS